MRAKRWVPALAGVVLLFPTVADCNVGVAPDDSSIREELVTFVHDLRGAPGLDSGRLDAALREIEALSPEEEQQLEEALALFPEWRSIPELARQWARFGEVTQGLSRERAKLTSVQQELERRREELRDATPETRRQLAEALAAATAEAHRLLDELGGEEFEPLRKAFAARGLTLPGTTHSLICGCGCGLDVDCWVDCVDCLINKVGDLLDDIADFVDDATDFITDIADSIVEIATTIVIEIPGLLTDLVNVIDDLKNFLLDNFPTSAGDLEDLLFSDPDWFEAILDIPPLEPPCPPMGSEIPGIGEVGSIRAEWVCRRGIDWFAAVLYDLVPDDVLSVPAKLPATFLYYPINYFCLCMASQSAISFSDAQADHRDHVDDQLDLALSTRATQISVDFLRALLADLDGDIAAIEVKGDLLDMKADELQAIVDDQDAFLEVFHDLVVRLNIEENMLESSSDVIADFQLPELFGGALELVRVIVAESIQMTIDAGEDIHNALNELVKGDEEFAKGQWEDAYEHYQKAYRQAVKR